MKKKIMTFLITAILLTCVCGSTPAFAENQALKTEITSQEEKSETNETVNKITSAEINESSEKSETEKAKTEEAGIEEAETLKTESDATDATETLSVQSESSKKFSAPQLKSCTSLSKGLVVKWKAVKGAAKYKVYRRTSSGKWTYIGKTKATQFKDKKAKKGKLYYYTVRAISKKGKKSSYDSVGISGCFLPGVSISSGNNSNDGIVIKWNSVAKASYYKIYKRTSNSKWSAIAKVKDALSYKDKDVKDGTTYQYVVRACTVKNDKSYTGYYGKNNIYSAAKMATPSFKVSSYKTEGVKISWSSVAGAAKYYVYKKDSSGKWVKAGKSTEDYFVDTNYTGIGLKNVYTVRAVDANGNKSTYDKTGKTGVFIPAVSNTTLSNGKKGIKVTWDKVKGASGYVIYYKKSGGSWTKVTTLSGSASTSFSHYVTFKSGTTYTYKVKAYKKVDGVVYYSSYISSGKKSIKWVNKMIISPLADGASLCTWEYNDRNGNTITRITPHQMVAHWTGKQCADYFVNNGIENSANYCIGYDGSIYCNVTEDHRAWTSSSWSNDVQSITVELSNTTDIYSGEMTDETIEAFINLCVDLIQRYPSLGGKFVYTGDSSCATGNISLHRWFSNTTCPGDWFVKKLPYIEKEVNKRLKELNNMN